MKNALQFLASLSIRFKMAAVVFLCMLFLGGGALYQDYRYETQRYGEYVENDFSLIADILKNDVTRWLETRENEVVTMAANPLVQQSVTQIVRAPADAEQVAEPLARYWKQVQLQYGIYDEIYFCSESGEVLVSTDPRRENTFRPRDNLITKPLETGELYFHDAYIAYSTNRPSIAYSIPVTGPDGGDGATGYAGVLVYRIEIEPVLRPLLETRVSLGETGEVILIDKNRTAITELRGLPGSALRYTLPTEPALRVSAGEEGLMTGTGYTEREILSAYRYLPATGWGLIVRQETAELYGSLKAQMLRSLLVSSLSIVLIIGLILLLLDRLLKPASLMAGVARDIARGDFSRRVAVQTGDEIGVLGRTLNSMADRLEQQFTLHRCRQDVLQALVSTLVLEDLLRKGLDTVCERFGFHVGAAFLVEPEKGRLVRKALYCPGPRLLAQDEALPVDEGLEGLAVRTKRVRVVTDQPDDTVYTVNWLGGEMRPGTIVTVPLMFGTEPLGVMTLASLDEVNETVIEELSTIGALIGVAVNNALSYGKTVELSDQLQDTNEQLVQQNEELNAQGEELLAQTEELQAQSEELQNLASELEAKNAELERLGERKLKYLASLSHELRAPLNAVIGFSDVLLDQVVGELNEKQEKFLRDIYASGQHLLALINDLLDLSRIEAGEVELDIKEIDAAVPLEEALAMVSAEVTRKHLEVNNLLTRGAYRVMADQDRLKQVFVNLLTNAVKFTPEHGRITIGARSDRKTLHVWVADTGIGIAREYHEIIFEEFRQAGSISKAFGGTGLGLAITRKLLELQGGVISVRSEEGKGATFSFTLPLVSAGDDVPADRGDCPVTVTYLRKPLDEGVLLGRVEAVAGRLAGKPVVLVVDDDAAVTTWVAAVLRPRGYEVLTAENGNQGIELAKTGKPDIIILDIMMPGIDGLQVMDVLSDLKWEKAFAVFICTSKDLSIEEKQYLESRAARMNERISRTDQSPDVSRRA
ncbi:MAG: response regulator [Candidatus Desulforudis sp.]|nr:response regulator [Desulforudis sp.]